MKTLKRFVLSPAQLLAVVLSAVVGLTVFSSSPSTIFAQAQRGGSAVVSQEKFKSAIETAVKSNTINNELYTHQGTQALGQSLITLMSPGLGANGEPNPIFGMGAIDVLASSIGFMYQNPPASTQIFLADAFSGMPFVDEVSAQGLGFASLDPVLATWKTFRDLAYVFFVIAFIVIGFMIMFRQKLGSQVVTVTSAIPNLIVTLLMITFSYAIAGFMIDVMYLSIYLIISLFSSQVAGNPPLVEFVLNQNIFQISTGLVWNNRLAGGSVVSDIGTAIGSMVNDALNVRVVGGIANVLAQLVISVAIFFAMFKIFFQLLTSYAMFLIAVVTSPLSLLINGVGGKNDVIQWIRNMASHLAPFPLVIAMLILVRVFTESTTSASAGFNPPLLGFNSLGAGTGGIGALIAVGILMLIPESVKLAKEFTGAKDNMFAKYMKDIQGNLQKGWSGDKISSAVPFLGGKQAPGIANIIPSTLKASNSALEALPINVLRNPNDPTQTIWRTTGKETGIERALIGTRQSRAALKESYEEALLHGKGEEFDFLGRQLGGLVGFASSMKRKRPDPGRSKPPANYESYLQNKKQEEKAAKTLNNQPQQTIGTDVDDVAPMNEEM